MTDARTHDFALETPGSAALQIAVVGPTHPSQGGVAAHTTMLAHHLADAGHDVTLVSWAHPAGLHQSEGALPTGSPEVPPFPRTIRALNRARPDSWVRVGRRLRGADAVVIVHALPAVVPAHLALLRAAGALPGSQGSDVSPTRPQSIVLCHNVVPLDPRSGNARLMAALLGRADSVLVHTVEQAAVAHDLGARRVSVADLPPLVLGGDPVSRGSRRGPVRLLALGLIPEHQGIDVLLRAMRSVPDVTLTIAGELWGADRQVMDELVSDPRLSGRVVIRDGDVPADALAALLADHDVLAVPSRSATSTSDVVLAHAHGLPVLATTTAPFTQQVVDGVNGLLVPPGDEQALVGALRRLLEPDVRHRLAEGVKTPDLSGPWAHYLGTLEALSVDTFVLDGPADPPAPGDPVLLGTWWAAARRRVENRVASRRAVVALDRDDLPDWVLTTDVLGEPSEADDVKRLARALGLPRSLDRVASWAALGALAAIVRVRDDGRRSAVIVDETGTRSLFSRWARAVGFVPVEIDFTGAHPSVAALDVDTGSLDVIVRIHPRGCDGADVDHVLEQAAWALRSHGLLIITVPIGPPGADGAVSPSDVRGILARADDLGFVLIGDLDGSVNARMREAAERARADDAAYGLVRLTLRRR